MNRLNFMVIIVMKTGRDDGHELREGESFGYAVVVSVEGAEHCGIDASGFRAMVMYGRLLIEETRQTDPRGTRRREGTDMRSYRRVGIREMTARKAVDERLRKSAEYHAEDVQRGVGDKIIYKYPTGWAGVPI